MTSITKPIVWFYHAFGLAAIHDTGRNAYLIIAARTLRMVAHGANTLILGMFRVLTCDLNNLVDGNIQHSSSPNLSSRITELDSS